jgi:hypothetical protein
MVLLVDTHFLKRLKYLPCSLLNLGVTVFLQSEHLNLREPDEFLPQAINFLPQEGQLYL